MDKASVLDFIIITGVIILFVGVGMIIVEVWGAYQYCHVQEGKYKLNISEEGIKHLCNDLKISRYTGDDKTIWDFEKNRNFTISFNFSGF